MVGGKEMKKRINVTMEQWLVDTVDKMAKERGIDRSSMISILVYDANQLVELKEEGATTASITGIGDVH